MTSDPQLSTDSALDPSEDTRVFPPERTAFEKVLTDAVEAAGGTLSIDYKDDSSTIYSIRQGGALFSLGSTYLGLETPAGG